MSIEKYIHTRREFLRNMAIAGVGIAALPAFLTDTLAAGADASLTSGDGDPILVVLQLGGGNDGLNTVVPWNNDHYHRARGNLALKKNTLIRLNDDLAFHPSMAPMMDLIEKGKAAVLNGVGYPNPNRSHFRSMEIWHTATDSDRFASEGWIGKYFDSHCPDCPPVGAVHVGQEAPQAFAGNSGVGVAFTEPDHFRWHPGERGNTAQAYEELNPVASSEGESNLDFLRHVTTNTIAASRDVLRTSRVQRQPVEYPTNQLGRSLRTIATLIAGGLRTRVFYTSITGFDTHANQLQVHANLLGQFSEGVAAFWKDLEAIGVADRVTILCFSEFGRRVAANASAGTDHGAAGPMFLVGNRVKAGLHGDHPSLDPKDLEDGDLRHGIDFRAVYTEVLAASLGADAARVLGREFTPPGVLQG